jgi:hypothetical protein
MSRTQKPQVSRTALILCIGCVFLLTWTAAEVVHAKTVAAKSGPAETAPSAGGGSSEVVGSDPIGTAGGGPVDPVDSIVAPDLPWPGVTELFLLRAFSIPPESRLPGDRGSSGSDGRLGLPPAEPNALERVKLEMARQAVSAARMFESQETSGRTDSCTPAPKALAAEKLRRLAATPPAVLPPDAAAGVGRDLPSRQESGAVGLTRPEAAKLQALRGSSPPADPPQQTKTEGKEGR